MCVKNISVIIPNYNQTHLIAGAIQSVLNQTYPVLEIIVVDDGSTDNSQEVITGFGDQVRYIWQENRGLAGARNTGIQAARGELIGLLDADDEWKSNFLENMIQLTKRFPDAAVYYCCAQGMDTEGNDLPQEFGGPAIPSEMMYHTLLRANFLIPSTIILRRSVIISSGMFDQSLRHCEDWDLWLRLLPQHKFVGTSKCLVRYRIHRNSLSADASGQQQTTRAMIEKHFGLDDGQWECWTPEKRRAFGGVYRLYVLTSIQRQNDWQACSHYLYQALKADPTLAGELNFFYDLALGNQPPGYRGTSYKLSLERNAAQIDELLENVFTLPIPFELKTIHRHVLGTANYAIGLVAYNTNQRNLSKQFLFRALFFLPSLFWNKKLVSTLVKSYLNPSLINRLKQFRNYLKTL